MPKGLACTLLRVYCIFFPKHHEIYEIVSLKSLTSFGIKDSSPSLPKVCIVVMG